MAETACRRNQALNDRLGRSASARGVARRSRTRFEYATLLAPGGPCRWAQRGRGD